MSAARTRRPTQADVAQMASVSQAVVSYVLNGDPTRSVAPATRARVLAAVEELGYVPDRTARNLRQRRTFTIAGIIPDITNPFYPAFERGVQDVAEAHGYDLITYNTDGKREKELRAIRSVRESRVDGVILTTFHLDLDELLLLVADGMALVINGEPSFDPVAAGIDQVQIDNAAAAEAIVTWLLDRGHVRVGMIAGEEGTYPREGRVRGYTRALAGRHIPLDHILVRSAEFSVAGGYDAADELLNLDPLPTAIFAANDLMAMGALMRFREAGLRVPEDIAVAGFDDIPAAPLVHPALTTIAQHPEQIGRRAAEMIVERLAGSAPEGARRAVLPFDLIVRDSA
ncbi:MAG: LacI family DNA-binding transcriptional regulator [Thermomicrobiales bacterium]